MDNRTIIDRTIQRKKPDWSLEYTLKIVMLRCIKWGEKEFTSKDYDYFLNKFV
jgi:hypothetical protein